MTRDRDDEDGDGPAFESSADGALEGMRFRNWMAFQPASKLIFLACFMAVLVPSILATAYVDPAASGTLFVVVSVAATVAAFVLTSMIERWLRRWFFF